MTDTFEHPCPDDVPVVAWGAPIPLRWERVGEGFWHVWPPSKFRLASDHSEWVLGGERSLPSFYMPKGPPEGVARGTPVQHDFSHKSPIIEWGEDFPANWNCHADGRLSVHLASLRARCGNGLIYFRHFTRNASFFYPSYYFPSSSPDAWTSSPLQGRAEYMGYAWGSRSHALHWRTPTSDDRWRLGQLHIDPPETQFYACDELMPLKLPTEDEIEEKRQSYLGLWGGGALERGDIHYSTMAVDLSRNSELMDLIGRDTFSAQVQRFMVDHHLVRSCDGAHVFFGSERNYGAVLSWLRRYGETYMMYDSNWAEADPDAQLQIARMFADSGYVAA